MWREENTMLMNSNEYLHIVESIKQEIRTAQYRAAVSVNRELLVLYHSIGEVINAHKTWGSKFVEKSCCRHQAVLSGRFTGYSARNLKYMAKFAEAYPDDEFVQQPVAQIPWGHNVVLLDKLSSTRGTPMVCRKELLRTVGRATCWFTKSKAACISGRSLRGKSHPTLKSDLPSPQSELAAQTMKDPYHL